MKTRINFSNQAKFEKPLLMFLAGYSTNHLHEKIDKDFSLSKYQMLQLFTYYFLNPDSNNFVHNIPIEPLSKLIGCSIRSIKNSNIELSNKELISYTTYEHKYLTFKLHTKDNSFFDHNIVESEYILIRKGVLLHILEANNINSIRIIFRFILRLNEVDMINDKGSCYYSYNDLKRFLPSNINHKKIIDDLVLESISIFNIDFVENGVIVSFK